MTTEIAILGGGCFWCLEAVYQELPGVTGVVSGYAGGVVPNPSYEQVCSGTTGHAEVVQITFDPSQVSYRKIVELFFIIHDPTTLNRQGNDIGTQYRSVVFYHTEQQHNIAQHVIAEMACVWDAPLVTELRHAPIFYRAESLHQDYYRQHPNEGYCAMVIAPKLNKLRKMCISDQGEVPTNVLQTPLN
ncbi:MAG: msrA [Solimicrobium sp.]|nr:msrA [Solimicrobium sp.]